MGCVSMSSITPLTSTIIYAILNISTIFDYVNTRDSITHCEFLAEGTAVLHERRFTLLVI